MTWSPATYLRHDGPRLRPALDLLAAIDHPAPDRVWDLGCGTGRVTAVLADRWPAAEVHGLDSSAEMLAQAPDHDRITWTRGDIASWSPTTPVDIVYSNAALHWVADHPRLLPRLLGTLAPGGSLAVQMPGNHDAPTHRVLREVAGSRRWATRLESAIPEVFVLGTERYLELLEAEARRVSVWETTYLQVLDGPDPVAEWVRGAAAVPYLDVLDSEEADAFMSDYSEAIRPHYPARSDGTTLLPFRRVFFLATI